MKKYAVIALVMLLVPFMAAASGTEEKTEYVFATDATWPPFEYIDENGNLTGFEVELVPMIGEAVQSSQASGTASMTASPPVSRSQRKGRQQSTSPPRSTTRDRC